MLAGLLELFGNLGWTLLHSLWQGTLACLAVIVFRVLSPSSASSTRYLFQSAMLAACLTAFIATFSVYQFSSSQMGGGPVLNQLGFDAGSADILGFAVASQANDYGTGFETLLSRYAPLIGAVWCLGFSVLSVHYARRLNATQKLRTMGLSPVPTELTHQLDHLVNKIGLRRNVGIHVSNRVRGPLTLGALKPIILVPASFLTRLHQDEIEAILLHELAHIHRHDYLVNLVQTAIRSIFFYHPAISYISRKIDEDREYACDDFAVATTQNPIALARGLATTRIALSKAQFGMAADGNDTPLIGRLKRLTGHDTSRSDQGAVVIPLAAFGIIAFAFLQVAGANMTAQAAPQTDHSRYDKQSYRFEHVEISGTTVTAKITDDGRRWILRDEVWLDLDIDPRALEKLKATSVSAGEMPQPPEPPTPPNYVTSSQGSVDLMGGADELNEAANQQRLKQFEIDMQYFDAEMQLYREELEDYVESANRADIKNVEARAERLFERSMERAERNREIAEQHAEDERERTQDRSERKREQAEDQAARARLEADPNYERHQVFQAALVELLITDGYISSSVDEFDVKYSSKAMYVNGAKVSENAMENYCDIMSKAGLKKANQSHIIMENGGRSFSIHTHGK